MVDLLMEKRHPISNRRKLQSEVYDLKFTFSKSQAVEFNAGWVFGSGIFGSFHVSVTQHKTWRGMFLKGVALVEECP
jgi:hypothetical protein